MFLGFLKWLKEISFYERKDEIIIKTLTFTKGKLILRTKTEFLNFRIKEKLILWIPGSKGRAFQRKKLAER